MAKNTNRDTPLTFDPERPEYLNVRPFAADALQWARAAYDGGEQAQENALQWIEDELVPTLDDVRSVIETGETTDGGEWPSLD